MKIALVQHIYKGRQITLFDKPDDEFFSSIKSINSVVCKIPDEVKYYPDILSAYVDELIEDGKYETIQSLLERK